MEIANRLSVLSMKDHLILRFTFAEKENDAGAEVATIALPLVAGFEAALELLGKAFAAATQMQGQMANLQTQVDRLNTIMNPGKQ